MRRVVLALAGAVALSSSCYQPTFADCTVLCGADGSCPAGQHCSSGGQCTAHAQECLCRPPPQFDFERSDVYVGGDPAATSGSGAVCPYATITAAVQGVTGGSNPVTIHVSAGTYDVGHGETFPIVVRGPISIVGAGAGNTIVNGFGYIAHQVDQGVFNNSEMSDWPISAPPSKLAMSAPMCRSRP